MQEYRRCGFNPWVRKISWRRKGDVGSIPGLGRSPGGGNDNTLQYSCLENPMDRGTWWATVQFPRLKRVRHDWPRVHMHTPTQIPKLSAGLLSFQELEEKSHSLPILASKGHLLSLAFDPPSSIFKARKGRLSPCYVTSFWPYLLLHLPHLRTHDYIGSLTPWKKSYDQPR